VYLIYGVLLMAHVVIVAYGNYHLSFPEVFTWNVMASLPVLGVLTILLVRRIVAASLSQTKG